MAKNHRSNKRKTSSTQNKNSMKPLIWITIGFAAVIILLAVLTVMQNNQQHRFTELPDLTNQQVYGDETAPVTLIEFGDYLCPTCMQWDKLIFPRLHEDYIETGKVKYVFINTPFQQGSQLAALASESVYAQDPGNFWDFHKAIFDAQATYGHSSSWLTMDLLLSLAEEYVPGIDLVKLEADITNQTALPELQTDLGYVAQYEVNLTPTVMINGIKLSGEDGLKYEAIKDTIEKELEASGQ